MSRYGFAAAGSGVMRKTVNVNILYD